MLNDNERRAPEWRRLLGEFFPPRLGGSADAWEVANGAVMEEWWPGFLAHLGSARDGVGAYRRESDRRWLLDMCAQVGVPSPPAGTVAGLVAAAHRYVGERCRSAYPDAAPAVRALAARGFHLHTASGEDSGQLDSYLRGMGLRDQFDRLYGPDLVDRWKNGPHYYAAILIDSGLDPRDAAVVDDSAEALDWARACGLRTLCVDRVGTGDRRHETIATLDELPAMLFG